MSTLELPPKPRGKGRIDKNALGFELEVELPKQVRDFSWVPPELIVAADGSLRGNGYEFISKPLVCAKLEEPIALLFKGFKDMGNLPTPSYRTSVHVHLNMLGKEVEECLIFISLYYLVEPFLFILAGKERPSSPFCVSSDSLPMVINREVLNGRNFWEAMVDEERNKYSSLNLAPFSRIGTFECRIMSGLRTAEGCNNWLKLLCTLRESASKFKSLKQLSKTFNDSKYRDFLRFVLEGSFNSDCLPEFTRDLEKEGYSKALPILSLDFKLAKARQELIDFNKKKKQVLKNIETEKEDWIFDAL